MTALFFTQTLQSMSVCLFFCLSWAVCRLRFGTTVFPIGRTERMLAAARRFDQHGRSALSALQKMSP